MLDLTDIDYLIEQIQPIADDKPDEGWSPMFYHTLTYEGDIKIWDDAQRVLKKLIKMKELWI